MVWFIATIIGLFLLTIFLSIPSFISLYKMGYKNYIYNIKFLYHNYKNIKKCYRVMGSYNMINKNYRFYTYYYPIINADLVYVIDCHETFRNLNISKYSNHDGNWRFREFNDFSLNCMITLFLYNRFLKKLELFSSYHIDIDNLNELDRIINSDIKAFERENKLKFILNE